MRNRCTYKPRRRRIQIPTATPLLYCVMFMLVCSQTFFVIVHLFWISGKPYFVAVVALISGHALSTTAQRAHFETAKISI
jgi:hypothetical protein